MYVQTLHAYNSQTKLRLWLQLINVTLTSESIVAQYWASPLPLTGINHSGVEQSRAHLAEHVSLDFVVIMPCHNLPDLKVVRKQNDCCVHVHFLFSEASFERLLS